MASIPALVSPTVLRWARASSGLAAAEAARKIGVSEPRLADWETGTRHPTIVQMRKVAHVYRRPLAVFFLDSPPVEEPPPTDFRRLPAEVARADPAELRHELRRAAYRRALIVEMAPATQRDVAALFGSATLDTNVESAAEEVRRRLRVPVGVQRAWTDTFRALREWRSAAESIGILVFRFSGVPTETARGFSIGAMPWPVVGLNSKDSPAGRCFTLMHEIGHLVLGEGGTCDLDDQRGGVASVHRRAETYCNRLAANVLMPRATVLQLNEVRLADRDTAWSAADLHVIARTFSVSREAALVRLLELGKTNRPAFDATREELRRLAAAAPETSGFELPPQGALREVGETFARFVLDAYHAERITARDVSDYLGVQFKHVGSLEDLLQNAGPNL